MGSTGGAVSYEPEARARGRRGAERPLKLVPVPSTMGSLERRPLPPLRPTRRSGIELPAPPDGPSWSPLLISLPLFAAVWVCFVLLARSVAAPPAGDVARLGDMLAVGAAVVGLVLVTLSVAHAQVSGLAPRPAVVGTLALGGAQVVAVAVLGSGLWGLAARVFALVAVTVPLASVGGQFQSGVRRHRFERDNSLVTTFTDRVRRQARATVESVHRHDVRSMLFVIEGATRVLADTALPEDQRASFTEMLDEGLGRLAKLTDVSTEEIGAFAVDDVVRAVAHAERKAGRSVMVDVPARLSAVGRAADVAAVLRTLATIAGRDGTIALQVRGRLDTGAAILVVEPAGTIDLPLLTGNWEELRVESIKFSSAADEEEMNLFVAARLLADQGADLWSTAGRARFAVRLPALPDPSSEEHR